MGTISTPPYVSSHFSTLTFSKNASMGATSTPHASSSSPTPIDPGRSCACMSEKGELGGI